MATTRWLLGPLTLAVTAAATTAMGAGPADDCAEPLSTTATLAVNTRGAEVLAARFDCASVVLLLAASELPPTALARLLAVPLAPLVDRRNEVRADVRFDEDRALTGLTPVALAFGLALAVTFFVFALSVAFEPPAGLEVFFRLAIAVAPGDVEPFTTGVLNYKLNSYGASPIQAVLRCLLWGIGRPRYPRLTPSWLLPHWCPSLAPHPPRPTEEVRHQKQAVWTRFYFLARTKVWADEMGRNRAFFAICWVPEELLCARRAMASRVRPVVVTMCQPWVRDEASSSTRCRRRARAVLSYMRLSSSKHARAGTFSHTKSCTLRQNNSSNENLQTTTRRERTHTHTYSARFRHRHVHN